MIIKDLQPYSVVEDDDFKNLIKLSYPKYDLPGRKYFVNYVNKVYEEKSEKLINKLKDIKY